MFFVALAAAPGMVLMVPPEQPKTVKLDVDAIVISQPRWGDAYLDGRRRLTLEVLGTTHNIVADFQHRDAIIIGRIDRVTGLAPDIDLTAYGAEELGVSRQHARLELGLHIVYITDLGSTNATYLNGHRLEAYQPRILRDGDVIWLGRLKLHVSFGNQLEDRHLSAVWSSRRRRDPVKPSPSGDE